MREFIKRYFGAPIRLLSAFKGWLSSNVSVRNPKIYGRCSDKVLLGVPLYVSHPESLFIDDYCRLQPGTRFIIDSGRVVIKRFTAIGAEAIIVTGNHISTVGVPHFFLGLSHINDREQDVIIEEDVWVGARVTILSGVTIGRGAIVAAAALVNRSVPPYAVVAGVPAKVVASKFSVEQILEHERRLYPSCERISKRELEDLFDRHFSGKKHYGTSNISPEDSGKLNELMQKWGTRQD